MKIKTKLKIIIFTNALSLLTLSTALVRETSKYTTSMINIHKTSCEKDDIDIIAHRGFSSLALDNSKEAIALCSEYNCVDGIEIDIRLLQDNTIVLSHNSQVTTSDNKTFDLSQIDYHTIEDKPLKNDILKRNLKSLHHYFDIYTSDLKITRKKIRNDAEQEIITLEEALSYIDEEKDILIDIKYSENETRFNRELFHFFKKYKNRNITFQSFDLEPLIKLRQMLPQFEYQFIVNEMEDMDEVKLSDIKQLGIKRSLIEKIDINSLLNEGYQIDIWNINDYKTFVETTDLLGANFDKVAYISDYPDCVCYWVKQKKK